MLAMSVDWGEIAALAQAVSGTAVVVSLLLVAFQLRQQGRDQFVSATASTFEIWISEEFQQAQQWVLGELSEQTWRAFTAAHRGKYGERAVYRVGSFYNRIGYLVIHDMLGGHDRILLDNLAGSAIRVWRKIEPLVLEARLVENSMLFQDFERMLPECYACYVPSQALPLSVREGTEPAARLARDKSRTISSGRR